VVDIPQVNLISGDKSDFSDTMPHITGTNDRYGFDVINTHGILLLRLGLC
jgi:hypothetical protein